MSVVPAKPVFILTVKIFLAPENVAKFFEHFKPVYEKALAAPECVYFLVGQNSSEPGVMQWTEGWAKDAEWFMKVQWQSDETAHCRQTTFMWTDSCRYDRSN